MRGVVMKSTGSWYNVLLDEGTIVECRIKGVFRTKGIKTTNPIAVGDFVEIENEEQGKGVIKNILERKNYIIRKSTNLSKQYHIIAANIDQAMLIVTLALPRTSFGFIDRFLVTAQAYGIPAIIVFNKYDLFENDSELEEQIAEVMAMYSKAGYTCIAASAINKKGVKELVELTKGKTTLLSGHSGVGKSSLINVMDNNLQLKTGELSDAHLKGKHTTTFAEMHSLTYGGYMIDTPGIKELGLVDMEKQELTDYFPEFFAIKHLCKFNNCLHINEPDCAIIKAVESGEIAQSRYNSYLGIINGEEMEVEYD